MKILKYKGTEAVTVFTQTFVIQTDESGNPIMIFNSYSFLPNATLEIANEQDANELLLNGIFEEVV
jgi:hypothetical protein